MQIFKPAIMLFLVTLTAGLLLGGVNAITLPKAQEQQHIALMKSLEEIFPQSSFEEIDVDDENIVKCYKAALSDGGTGYIFEAAPNGYGGTVQVLCGINADGSIAKVIMGEHSETPGLGANATKPSFTEQYQGKTGHLNVVKQSPGESDIVAITSATITTNAITTGVNYALDCFASNFAGGGN